MVEETADTIYLVLPNASPAGEGGELSDRELETVAGGWGSGCYSTWIALGLLKAPGSKTFDETRLNTCPDERASSLRDNERGKRMSESTPGRRWSGG